MTFFIITIITIIIIITIEIVAGIDTVVASGGSLSQTIIQSINHHHHHTPTTPYMIHPCLPHLPIPTPAAVPTAAPAANTNPTGGLGLKLPKKIPLELFPPWVTMKEKPSDSTLTPDQCPRPNTVSWVQLPPEFTEKKINPGIPFYI